MKNDRRMGQIAQEMTWDVAWPDKAQADRDELFAALVQRQSKFVFGIAFAVLRNAQNAEDAAQETFLKLYRQRAFERIEDERAYLARAAWRIAAARRKRETAHLEVVEQPSPERNPEQALAAVDWTRYVHGLIDKLPEDLRHPLLLSAVEEMKSQEIAAVLEIPEGTVRNRISRARQLLKQKLSAMQEAQGGR